MTLSTYEFTVPSPPHPTSVFDVLADAHALEGVGGHDRRGLGVGPRGRSGAGWRGCGAQARSPAARSPASRSPSTTRRTTSRYTILSGLPGARLPRRRRPRPRRPRRHHHPVGGRVRAEGPGHRRRARDACSGASCTATRAAPPRKPSAASRSPADRVPPIRGSLERWKRCRPRPARRPAALRPRVDLGGGLTRRRALAGGVRNPATPRPPLGRTATRTSSRSVQ